MVPHVSPYIILWLRILQALKVDWESAVHQNCHSCAQGPSCLLLHNVTQHVQVSAVGIADLTHFLILCAMVLLLHSTTNNLYFFYPFFNVMYNINSGIGVTGQFGWSSVAIAFKNLT